MLGKLFGGSISTKKGPGSGLSSGLIETILNVIGARSIPPMPNAAQRAFELATNPDAQARDFVDVIEGDEALSARIIKIANSVYYDRGKRSETIEDCVNVVGINELRCLLNATSLNDIFPSSHPARTQLWVNDIATGLIAKDLARRAMPGKESLAFLGGLMHDIGKLLLLQRCGEEYSKLLAQVASGGKTSVEAEDELFAFNHTQVGVLIGERWRFSPDLLEAIRDHHLPVEVICPPGSKPNLTALIACADTIAHALALGHPAGMDNFKQRARNDLPQVWRILDVPLDRATTELDTFKRVFDLEADLYLHPR
jgi:putative nucleotidyltransferase with HDIG domain